jgi:hypothetical protein
MISFSQVKITEVMSSSNAGTGDWIELTNFGTTAVDITGWRIDDNTYNFLQGGVLEGVTSLPAGKSVVFLEVSISSSPTIEIPNFKSTWGSKLNNVTVGSYTGNVGFSGSGEGTVIFKSDQTEVCRVNFGAATLGSSFYWTYKLDGTSVASAVISTIGIINGTNSNQDTFSSASSLKDIGSPGTAVVAAITADVNNPNYRAWRLEGSTLKFDAMPETAIDVYALTGSKVFTHNAAREIKLELKQGIYILKVDGKATKITIR